MRQSAITALTARPTSSPPTTRHRPTRGRRLRSSTPTTTRGPRATWRTTGPTTVSPPCATANGCFMKVDERGGTNYPQGDQTWGLEISLDLDMVSAICPNCRILLVEADSNSTADLGAAVNEAVALGASVVSNSYGSAEYSGEVSDNAQYYDHPGVAIVSSSGDGGYGTQFPAAAPNVVAVGGTSLDQATDTGTRNATETAWSGSGSGCSVYFAKPSWQHDTGCANRSIADVSAVADPNTGVWVWDTYPNGGGGIVGGTGRRGADRGRPLRARRKPGGLQDRNAIDAVRRPE